jgi:hypothetical protein
MVLRWASESGRARCSFAVDRVGVYTELYRDIRRRAGRREDGRIGRNMVAPEKRAPVPTECHIGCLIFPSLSSLLTHLHLASTHHGSNTFVSQRSLQPRSPLYRMLQLTVMSPLRVSSITVYGRPGEAVQLSVDAFHTHPVCFLMPCVCSQCQ